MANNVNPDEKPCSAASHLGLHCLLKPDCPNTNGKYSKQANTVCYSISTHSNNLKYLDRQASAIDPDQMQHSAASDQSLYCSLLILQF